jgi:hypothetical protein
LLTAGEGLVPQYFFVVHGPDEKVDDLEGEFLLSDNAAIAHALRLISDIKKTAGRFDNSQWHLIVEDENREIVITIPL